MASEEQKLDQQIKKAETRNKYLRKNILEMRQALDSTTAKKEDAGDTTGGTVAAMKELETVQKNITIAQRQLDKIKDSNFSLEQLMAQSHRLQTQLKEKVQEKKNLIAECLKLKKELYLKQRQAEQPQGNARAKAQSYQLQIKVLNKKLSLLSTSSKPNASALMLARSPSQQPIGIELPSLSETRQDKLLKDEINLYNNLTQSYQKKLESLQGEIAALQLRQKQRASETQQVDEHIDQWIGKVQALKKLITPQAYRKLPAPQKKLVRLN